MTIDSLIKLLPPPGVPSETSDASWMIIEITVGTPLPSDYKEFIGRYGTGRINEFIWIFNPFTKRSNVELLTQQRRQIEIRQQLEREYGESCPFPLHPSVGGLLPCGGTDNGDTIFWLTHGAPSSWSIVVNESRGGRYLTFDVNLIEFIVNVLTKNGFCSLFPSGVLKYPPFFDQL